MTLVDEVVRAPLPTVPGDVVAALGELNTHARAFGSGRKAIYAYKALVAALLVARGEATVQLVGHHVEGAHGARGGIVAATWRRETRAKPLTSYCPDDNEWFAEYFRLFVTNPDLLSHLNADVWARMIARWPHRAETRDWSEVLAGAPRQLAAARNRIAKSQPRLKEIA